MFSLCVAMDQNRVIGSQNQLPWYLPNDLKNFRRLTLGKTVVMGRKTYESIGHPLPKRHNVILTTNPQYQIKEAQVMHHQDQLFRMEKENPHQEIIIIGGHSIYQQFLPYTNRIYMTRVWAQLNGDTYFPDYDMNQWKYIERQDHIPDSLHAYAYSFITLQNAYEHTNPT